VTIIRPREVPLEFLHRRTPIKKISFY